MFPGKNCLHLAASNGHIDIMRLLLRLGAKLDAREGLGGMTVLHIAVRNNNQDMINFLLAEFSPRFLVTDYGGLSPYQLAVLHHRKDIAEQLLDHGATMEESSDTCEDREEQQSWCKKSISAC